jgi:hypothetical protein
VRFAGTTGLPTVVLCDQSDWGLEDVACRALLSQINTMAGPADDGAEPQVPPTFLLVGARNLEIDSAGAVCGIGDTGAAAPLLGRLTVASALEALEHRQPLHERRAELTAALRGRRNAVIVEVVGAEQRSGSLVEGADDLETVIRVGMLESCPDLMSRLQQLEGGASGDGKFDVLVVGEASLDFVTGLVREVGTRQRPPALGKAALQRERAAAEEARAQAEAERMREIQAYSFGSI